MKNILTIVLVIIGDLIGAGFASGQEIYSFFFKYGINGLIGIFISCLIISISIYKILKKIHKNKINNYSDFLRLYFKNKKIIKIINFILNILLLISFYIMIAGSGAYFLQEFGINRILGSFIFSSLCAFVLMTNVKGVLKVSEYLVPILIFFILIIGIINIKTINLENLNNVKNNNWITSSITYVGYNLILLIPVLITISKQVKNEKNIKFIAIFSGIILFLLAITLYFLLSKIEINIKQLEMPIIYVIRKYYSNFKKIYSFIILASIFTTAISIGIAFLQNIVKNQKSYTQFVVIMCITSIAISNFGFSNLVNFIYPIFGYLGILQIIRILF